MPELERFLLDPRVDVNVRGAGGVTALHAAWNAAQVRLVLQHPRVDVGARDEGGRTALAHHVSARAVSVTATSHSPPLHVSDARTAAAATAQCQCCRVGARCWGGDAWPATCERGRCVRWAMAVCARPATCVCVLAADLNLMLVGMVRPVACAAAHP